MILICFVKNKNKMYFDIFLKKKYFKNNWYFLVDFFTIFMCYVKNKKNILIYIFKKYFWKSLFITVLNIYLEYIWKCDRYYFLKYLFI